MKINAFLIRIIFLALPGLLGCKLYRKLRGRTTKKTWEDFVEILLFSVISYALYGLVLEIASNQPNLWALQALFDSNEPLVWREIVIVSCIGVALGIAASYIHKYNILNGLARIAKASNRAGDEDVWNYLFNDPQTEWALVRDHKVDLMYFGYARMYSDSEKDREILLENVDVYQNSTGEFIYSTGVLYLSRKKDDLTVEIIGKKIIRVSDKKSFREESSDSIMNDGK